MKKFHYSRKKIGVAMVVVFFPIFLISYFLDLMASQSRWNHSILSYLLFMINLVLWLYFILLVVRLFGNQTVLEISEKSLVYRTGVISVEKTTWDEVQSLHYLSGHRIGAVPFQNFYVKEKGQPALTIPLLFMEGTIDEVEKAIQKVQPNMTIQK